MTIKSFIQQEILVPRLKQASVLVVYDPHQRYQALCLELANDRVHVVDTTAGSIESRASAMATLQAIGQGMGAPDGLLVYVPARPPLNDEEKQRDPFSVFGASGAVFPASDGDEYMSLCLKGRADYSTDIRRIFAQNPDPSFEVIDAIGAGANWPHLQALLGVESARDILFALLVPSIAQQAALKGQDTWAAEAKALFHSALSLKLLTRAKSWTGIADELWRFLLFSEFFFDLPGALPDSLANVPRALPEARPVVEDLCDRLRNDRRTQPAYISQAEAIELEMNLPAHCQTIADLGIRDTFPFEERTFLSLAIDALRRGDAERLGGILSRRVQSVWMGKGENQGQWQLLQAAASLVEACEEDERRLPDNNRSLDALLDYYVTGLREIDRLQREFEQAAGDHPAPAPEMVTVLAHARTTYQRLANTVQSVFVRHVEKSGWPPSGRLANADAFDRLVAPKLQESGRRVALFLIDALRYELGVELAKQLTEDGQAEVQPAFAQLPSITQVGMASLLPGAGQELHLRRVDEKAIPVLGDEPVTNVTQRIDVLRKRYGERMAEVKLETLVPGPVELAGTIELLVVRSNDMDEEFEHNPSAAPSLITHTFKRIRAALHKLRGLGFQDALILTDHGFILNPAPAAGDVCDKPTGRWTTIHERMLLGDGTGDAANFVLPAEMLGIRGDFGQAAGPRAIVAYRAGLTYLHGGLSLQETVVPVISMRLRAIEPTVGQRPKVTISYKRGAKKITTQLPVIEVATGAGDLFSHTSTFDVLLEAHDKQGNVVGEAKSGGPVNPATRTVTLQPGETVQVTIKMSSEYEGKVIIKALDPATLTAFDSLTLETDYLR